MISNEDGCNRDIENASRELPFIGYPFSFVTSVQRHLPHRRFYSTAESLRQAPLPSVAGINETLARLVSSCGYATCVNSAGSREREEPRATFLEQAS
ncbi:hypothetical protein MTO96_009508 [Rhipicephalus appendiculatus]